MRARTACVLVALLACLSYLHVASEGGTATVSTTRDLLAAIGNESVSEIILNDTLVLDGSIWNSSAGISANITRSLTLSAGPNRLTSKTYVLLDFNNLDAIFSLARGCVLRFVGLEIRNHLERRGTFFKPLRQSVGAYVEFRNCLLRRHAGFPAAAEVINLHATHRPATPDGELAVQECSVQQNLSYSTTGSTARVNVTEAVWLGDFATVVAEDSSLAFQGHQYGGYTYTVIQSYDVTDSVVPQSCLDTAPGDKCLFILLQQLDPTSPSPSSPPTTTSRWSHRAEVIIACSAAAAAVLVMAVVAAALVLVRRRRCRQGGRSSHRGYGCFLSLKHLVLADSQSRSREGTGLDAAAAASVADGAAATDVVVDGGGGGGGGGGGLVSDGFFNDEEEQQWRQRRRRRRLRGADDQDVEARLPPTDHFYSSTPGPQNVLAGVARADDSRVSASAAAGPGAAGTISSRLATVNRYTPGATVADVCAAADGSSNGDCDGGCVFLGLDQGQRLPDWLPSVIEQQDVGSTSRRRGLLSAGVATSLMSSPSYPPLSLRGLDVAVGRSGCGCRASDGDGDGDVDVGVGVGGGSSDDNFLRRRPNGSRTISNTRYGSSINSEDFSDDRCSSGFDDGSSHRQNIKYGNAEGGGVGVSVGGGGGGGGGRTSEDGNRQSVSDSGGELEPAASSIYGYESNGGDGGSVAVSPAAAGLAAVTAALAELDGSIKRMAESEVEGALTPNQHSINAPQLRLEGVLGCGSWGTVYQGTWKGLPVAVKTLVFSAAADDDGRRRAVREATLSASVSHPNIIAIYSAEVEPLPGCQWSSRPMGYPATALAAVGAGGGGAAAGRLLDVFVPPPPAAAAAATAMPSPLRTRRRRLSVSGIVEGSNSSGGAGGGGSAIMDWRLYIIQEYADAGPLGELYGDLDLWPAPGAPHLPSVVALALGIASALSYLHSKRIIHGDLNPNNVLLKRDSREPSGLVVKVADFGLSVMLPKNRSHLSNVRMGTMFYVCPAIVMKAQVGPASDVFSLGVMLWELYHGRRAGIRTPQGPRYSSVFPAFPPSCPEAYRAVALHCLQRQPQNRPSAAQVEIRLQRLLEAVAAPAAAAAVATPPEA